MITSYLGYDGRGMGGGGDYCGSEPAVSVQAKLD